MKISTPSLLLALLTLAATSYAGNLSGSLTPQQIFNYDLTTEGTIDWAVWGQGSSTSLAPTSRMAGGTGSISNLTDIALGGALRGLGQFGNYGESTFNWSNGTPSANGTSVFTGLQHMNGPAGEGFSFTVTAGTTPMELVFFSTVNFGVAQVTASLSDSSAPILTQNLTLNGFNQPYYSTIEFNADSPGQTLNVSLILTQNVLNGNVAIQGLALRPTPEPTSLLLLGLGLGSFGFTRFRKEGRSSPL